jgi:hypothetical protein
MIDKFFCSACSVPLARAEPNWCCEVNGLTLVLCETCSNRINIFPPSAIADLKGAEKIAHQSILTKLGKNIMLGKICFYPKGKGYG